MMDNIQDCSAHYMAHQQAITDTQKRLDTIEEATKGIPSEMQFIRANVDRMCQSMDKVLEKLETRYLQRDMFDTALASLKAQIQDHKEQTAKDMLEIGKVIGKLEERITWLTRGGVVVLLYILKDLVTIALHH